MTTQNASYKRIGDLPCIDRTRKSVHDASSAIINADMNPIEACRIMMANNFHEAFILEKNAISGMIALDELLKFAFAELESMSNAAQNERQQRERDLELQASLHEEIRAHLNAIHTGLISLNPSMPDLALVHAISTSTSAIAETLKTFEKAVGHVVTGDTKNHDLVPMNTFLTKIISSVQSVAQERGITIAFAPRTEYQLRMHRPVLSQAIRAVLDDMSRSFGPGTTIQIESDCRFKAKIGEAVLSISVQKGDVFPVLTIDRGRTLMSGLAHTLICEAVRLHNGVVVFNNDSDAKNLYEITMPGAETAEAEKTRPDEIKILIVEDDTDVLQLLQHIIESRGYKAILAEDGEEALRKFHEERPTLLLADVRMPKIDGIQLADQIKAIEPNLPVILFSGQLPNLFEAFQEKRIKADHVLYKPFATNDILESLTLLLPR